MEDSVPFDTTVEILIYVFISFASLCIGLSSTLKNLMVYLSNRDRIVRILVANVLLPPIVALIIIWVFRVEASAATVLLLLSFAPGGINAVQFSTKSPGQLVAAGELLIILSAIGLVVAPIAASLLLADGATIRIPLDLLLFRIVALVIVPFAIGMLLRSTASGAAEKIYKPAMLISTLAFIASVLLSMSVRQNALAELSAETTLAMLMFILVLVIIGWWLGGPEPAHRQVLAVTTNLRNVGLVYMLVEGCCGENQYSISVLAFMAIMVPVNLVLTIVCAILRKRRTQ